jgi:PIN domain nuclease of toxin-antitoxin system
MAGLTYLVDACGLLAYFGVGDTGMTKDGLDAMEGEVAVSPITVWELVHKSNKGQLPPLPRQSGSFARYLRGLGFQEQPFGLADAEDAARLPQHHKDPMDRMLIATALRADLTIITCDAAFRGYGVKMIW